MIARVLIFLAPACEGARADTWKLTLDGHARTMVEAYRNIEFGLGEVDDDAWLHQRAQAMLALEYEERFQLAAKLSWGDMGGRRSSLGPPDRDGAESELIVPAGHKAFKHPQAVAEIQRILRRHLR